MSLSRDDWLRFVELKSKNKCVRSVFGKGEIDGIRFNKDYFWKGRGFCYDCNVPVKGRWSLRCHSCASRFVHFSKKFVDHDGDLGV